MGRIIFTRYRRIVFHVFEYPCSEMYKQTSKYHAEKEPEI